MKKEKDIMGSGNESRIQRTRNTISNDVRHVAQELRPVCQSSKFPPTHTKGSDAQGPSRGDPGNQTDTGQSRETEALLIGESKDPAVAGKLQVGRNTHSQRKYGEKLGASEKRVGKPPRTLG